VASVAGRRDWQPDLVRLGQLYGRKGADQGQPRVGLLLDGVVEVVLVIGDLILLNQEGMDRLAPAKEGVGHLLELLLNFGKPENFFLYSTLFFAQYIR